MTKAILLLSGGLDSSTCFLIARAEGFEIHALSFDYGQRHAVELERARAVASRYGAASHRVVRIDADAAGATRDEYQRALAEENIATSIHFLPVHKLTYYRERFVGQPPLPVAERAGDEVLSLPLSPAHSDDDIADVVAALRRVHERFAG